MASLELITNLKLIKDREDKPLPTELPVGYMAFGVVGGRVSIWGNYNGTVEDLVEKGSHTVIIVQQTGTATNLVMSQKAVTDAIASAKKDITDNLGTAAAKDVGAAAGNVPVLDASGKLVESVIPAVAITDTFVVDSQTAMLALNAQKGDIAIRTDLNKSFVLQTQPASTLENWKELLAPTDGVLSVNGKTGTVILTGADITSTFTIATTRTNIATGETLPTSLGKIAKWFADLKGLAFKDTIVAATDILGIVPATNLPTASATNKGIASFGNGLSISNGVVSAKAGQGIIVDSTGIRADVVLKIDVI